MPVPILKYFYTQSYTHVNLFNSNMYFYKCVYLETIQEILYSCQNKKYGDCYHNIVTVTTI